MALGQAENHESVAIVRNQARNYYELESYLNLGLPEVVKSVILYGYKIQEGKKV